ncbi:Serine/threonine-protein kinase/endoribonuclease IRE2 [Fasciola hepatica]|uniref:Serine/threonine-protein kinase/endoribonuclease IRE2 n=1 Tax=Fasciola hepatica TaxID=6192 RepID=A0A4E0RQI7_FASHE|nr:Serine/threonine-protein kinase/endoribonuclease IRE2 [Fasciola hepatica]
MDTNSSFSSSYIYERKTDSSLDLCLRMLKPSLLVGSSVSAPLYAITCVAEASLKLRGIRRAPESFMIEGPIYLPAHLPKDPVNWSGIPTGLTGLYELPTGKSKTWPWNYQPPDPQLPQLGGPEIDCPGLTAIGSNTTERGRWHPVYLPLIAVTTLVCLFCTVYVLRRRRVFQFPRLISDSVDLSFLPTHFDTPDSTGWAGCTAQEAGQPEAIRINLNEVLGHGANGTMVFAGMFGTHQTAVKRIVRQPQLEKHWRREHAILLRHHHPHLVRCYWTGSTANFHYLVMQRCETTLSELLRTASPLHSFQMWGLTPCEVIHQVLQAVVCLHQNHIVHRDLKPSNVLIATGDFGGQARAVVGDFGLSRPMPAGRTDLTNSLGSHLTDTMWGTKTNSSNNGNPNPPGSNVIYHNNDVRSAGAVAAAAISPLDPGSDLTSVGVTFGTLGWMAPELCDPETKHLTYSIDIFACGLLAYHVLTGGEHPYDQSELSDSEQPSVKMDSGSSGTSNRPGAADSGINGINRHFPAISESNHSPTPVCHSIASRLSRHHARQLAIAENRTPSLNRLTESKCLVDLPRAFLGRQLIQTMLSHDPVDRPSAEEVIYDPLFWTASKTIRFLSELSDVLDTRDEEIQSTGSSPTNLFSSRQNNVNPRPTTHRFFAERRALLEMLNPHAPFVFSEHWFHRLEPELVLDLLNTRGYDLGLSKIRELLGSLQYGNPKSPSCNSQSYSPIISRRAEALKPWKRGEVVASSATINSASPSRVASNHPVRLEWETVSGSDLAPLSPPVEPAGLTVLDLSVAPDSVEHTGRRPRRRPNQAKKIRPRKKDKKAARERQEIVARAGCELSTAVKTKIISSSDS